ncbi:hypothetical protein Tdes44962_MAKER05015 [Teratosphaeria destructans]|uniref:Uncharacterized protein n=1 Tax=Teratosphaeria destructans TaxID=418781 RepID=A0A9W7SLK5_9PEZI|nr:hypothetical protein Tdes44962_MAKER05015 [Teratosphaeria destructans]
MITSRPSDPQHKVHHHSGQKRNRKHCRPKAIIEASLPSHPDTLRPPVERHQCVNHGAEGHQREESRGNLADRVPEIEEPDGQAAEDDGEVQPGEKGALVGEEYFGLDAGGKGDALAWSWCKVSLGLRKRR